MGARDRELAASSREVLQNSGWAQLQSKGDLFQGLLAIGKGDFVQGLLAVASQWLYGFESTLGEIEPLPPNLSLPPPSPQQSLGTVPNCRRTSRFAAVLGSVSVDKSKLADLVWMGVPAGSSRCEIWQMLLGYRPLAHDRRGAALESKRRSYAELRRSFYAASRAVKRSASTDMQAHCLDYDATGEEALLKQIRRDLPRIQVRGLKSAEELIDDARTQVLMERVLFVWAVRQPAAGYVQGVGDVLLPLLLVFIAERAGVPAEFLRLGTLDTLNAEDIAVVEADCYWCLTKILSEVADHYTDGQRGLQRAVATTQDLLARVDAELARGLSEKDVDMGPGVFRWVGCLMVRDLPMTLCLRLWDTCIAESAAPGGAGFAKFLVFFGVSLTASFSTALRSMTFDALMSFFQCMPVDGLGLDELEVLIAETHVLRSMFQLAPRHYVHASSRTPPCP